MNIKIQNVAALMLPGMVIAILANAGCAAEQRVPRPCESITLIGDQGDLPVIVHSNEEGKQKEQRFGKILVKDAAGDLQRYLKLVTGKQLPFDQERSDTTCIHVGQTRYVKAMRLGLEHLDYDGFIICTRFRGDIPQLIIAGRTPVGTYNGVNYFLRKYVGVQWLFPGELGEIVPKKTVISIPTELDDKQEPDYFQRGFGVLRKQKIWHEYKLRSLMISPLFRTVGGHAMGEVIRPEMYAEHPEYFPLIDGERFKPVTSATGWQPCLSNPEVVTLFIEAAKKNFDASPEHLCFSLSENDSGGYCECDNCKAMDYPDAPKWATDLCRNYADRSWKFYVQVAREIEKSHPGRYLGVYSYLWSNEPPSDPDFQMPNNMVIRKTFPHESDIDRFERWSKLGVAFGGHDYIYDTQYHAFRHYPHQLAHEIRFRYRRGMRSSGFENYSRPSKCAPKIWILTRLLWDIRENVDDLMREYCRHAYGSAAEPMLEFWNRWEQVYNRQDERARRIFFVFGYDEDLQLQTITYDDLKYLSKIIQRATTLAKTPDDQRRVRMVAEEYDHNRAYIRVILDVRQAYDKIKKGDSRKSLQSQLIQLSQSSGYLEDVWPVGRHPELGNFGTYGMVSVDEWTEVPSNIERCLDDLAQAITGELAKSRNLEKLVAYWTNIADDNPRLTKYSASQIYSLQHPNRANLIKHPLFATDQAGIKDWSTAKEGSGVAINLKPSRLETNLTEKGAEGVIGFKGFVWTDRVYQDVPIEPGKRYRAGISVLNRVNNQARKGWSDQAIARLKLTYDQKMRMVKTRLGGKDWQNIHLTFTAPETCQTARFEISVRHYLDDEEVRFTRPVLECISE